MTINVLPDDVFLEIFDLCRQDQPDFNWFFVWGQNGLVHVCQRWRRLVFGSACRLDLQLPCTHGTLVRKNLGCWPPIPITIRFGDNNSHRGGLTPDDEDSLFAAFEHPDRIRQIYLKLTSLLLEKVFMVMQQQFPVLTHLTLEWDYYCRRPPALPSGFLGRSALCLQYIHLEGIPFPELPILLSSTSDIIHLYLNDILSISPEAMIACLATLPRLEFLHIERIEFESIRSHPDQMLLLLMTRISLPVLSSFEFWGTSEYLEELISRIDSPRLNRIDIEYYYQPSEFQVTQLFQFIDSLEDPRLALIRRACVNISTRLVSLVLDPYPGYHPDQGRVNISTHCPRLIGQNSYLTKLFGRPSALLSRVVHLEFYQLRAFEDYRDYECLHILPRFTATRTLLLSADFAGDNTLTPEHVTGGTEILPVLDLIWIDSDGQRAGSCIKKFLAARRLFNRPVTVIKSKAEFFDRVDSYVIE